MSVADAAAHGTCEDLLRALRWRLELTFFDDATPSRALVSLSRVLREIVVELAQLEAGEEAEAPVRRGRRRS